MQANSDNTNRHMTRRTGFTLIEVLIVVVIMAILAATIIPQFNNSTEEARASTALFNLHSLRSQIELYKLQHNGKTPSASLIELTKSTDVAGNVGAGAAYPLGPYIHNIPENPFNNSATVAAPASVPPAAVVAGAGWQYDATSGEIWVNEAGYLDK